MIRINLLPVKRTQAQQSIKQQLVIGAAGLALTLVICAIWYAAVSSEADEQKKKIAEYQERIRKLEATIGEVGKIKTQRAELETKLKAIETLKKKKTGPVRALDDLATNMPERIWLTSMKESAGSVKFVGRAIQNEDVAALMKALQKSKYFNNIVLSYSKSITDQGATLYEFAITCRVDYSA